MAAKLTKAQWETRRKLARATDLPDLATVTVDVAGTVAKLAAMLRDFSTGSRGYHVAERISTELGSFQLNLTITQVGSGPYREA